MDPVDAIIEAWRRERPDLPLDATAVISRVWRLAHIFGAHRRRLLAAAGIDPSQMDLLSTLRRAGPPYVLTTREITDRTLVTAGAISQRLTRAERAGWVTRRRLTDRSRGVRVTLTADGIAQVDAWVDVVMHGEAALLAEVAHIDEIAAALRRLTAATEDIGQSVPRSQVGIEDLYESDR